jgi:hypothetical protein
MILSVDRLNASLKESFERAIGKNPLRPEPPQPQVVKLKHGEIRIQNYADAPTTVEWGDPKRSITVASYIWVHRVVDLIKNKAPLRFIEAYASMISIPEHEKSHDDVLFEMWKSAPCMHSGMPNKQAQRLLVGLRKNIPKSWTQMKGGYSAYPDRSISDLYEAKLVEQTSKKGMMTSMKGYQVLRHWADTRGSFEPYLTAYLPKNWETDYKSRKVFEAMQGGTHERTTGSGAVHR